MRGQPQPPSTALGVPFPLRAAKLDDSAFFAQFCSGWELVLRVVFAFCIVFCFNAIESSSELLELCFKSVGRVSGTRFLPFGVGFQMFKCFVNSTQKRIVVNGYFLTRCEHLVVLDTKTAVYLKEVTDGLIKFHMFKRRGKKTKGSQKYHTTFIYCTVIRH